jgi:hypothetical protein
MSDSPRYNDTTDRRIFGALIIGGNLLGMAILTFFKIPSENATVFGQIAGGLSASLGIVVAATWKTNATERQQAETNQTLAAALTTPSTTTTTVTKDDVTK